MTQKIAPPKRSNCGPRNVLRLGELVNEVYERGGSLGVRHFMIVTSDRVKSSDSSPAIATNPVSQFAGATGDQARTSPVADRGRMCCVRKHLCPVHFA